MKPAKNYWLLKTEADTFSIDDLKRVTREPWSGVRNYQARNFMRAMQVGDLCLFYHTGNSKSVAGIARVVSKPYPDPTQFDKKSHYFEPKATKKKPMWTLVDVSFVKKFQNPIFASEMRGDPALSGMVLWKAPRLSVQPVSEKHFKYIVRHK